MPAIFQKHAEDSAIRQVAVTLVATKLPLAVDTIVKYCLLGGVERMTVLGLIITFIIGILIIVSGVVTKKKWLMLISIIPLVIVLSQIALLFLMALN